jgi:large repetitive protein
MKHFFLRSGVAVGVVLTGALYFSSAGAATAVVPGAPTKVSVAYQAGTTQATVAWTKPSTGEPATFSYKVTSNQGGFTCSTTATSCAITGLSAGATYTFRVQASNATGTGPASGASAAITVTTVPGPVSDIVGVVSGSSLEVSWKAPTTGYPAASGYIVAISPGGNNIKVSTNSYTFSGLEAGVTYTVTVSATNSAGTGATVRSGPMALSGPPGKVGSIAVSVDGPDILVSWKAPTTGYPAPSAYTVNSVPGGSTCTTATTSCVMDNLSPATSYTFDITATNSLGTGPVATSASIETSNSPTTPGRPTYRALGVNVRTVTLSWAGSANCGTGCTYSVWANGTVVGSTAGTTLSVSRLSYGVAYSFVVSATSTGGTSAKSAATVVTSWTDVLKAGQSLSGTERLWSSNRSYYLEVTNKHLVVRSRAGRNRWVAPGGLGTEVSLTTTGNIEFTNGPTVIWESRTGVAGGEVKVSKTGLLQIWRGGRLLWQLHGGAGSPSGPSGPTVTVPAS